MKIAVTGGGGFLGRAIVRQYIDNGDDVVIVARNAYPEVESWGATQVRGDLADPAVALEAFAGCDAVIHTAAKAGIWGAPEDYYRSNVEATTSVIEACKKCAVPKLVYTSSPSVTFAGEDEENAPQSTPYAVSFLAEYPKTKAEAEKLVLAANSKELATVALRPHLIWGKGDPHLITRLVERHRLGKLKVVGNGLNRVDMTHVENAAHAHVLALRHLSYGSPVAGKAYFISDNKPIKMWEWLNQLFQDIGLPPLTQRVSAKVAYAAGATAETIWKTFKRPGEPPMTRFVARQLATSHWYDMTPAINDFGYLPVVSYTDAYIEMVEWIKDNLLC